MKKQLITLLIIFSIILSFSIPVGATTERKSVIVVFKNAPDAGLIKAHGGDIKYQYDIIPGIAVNMPVTALKGLQNHPNIACIEDDIQVHALGEELPWGVDRIDAEIVHTSSNKGTGIKVAILDTGIDYTHQDLDGNYQSGIDFVNDDSDPMDDNGHGTHVAGIIAAEDNDFGVIGVAPEAHLYGVKVLNNVGSGSLSDVIAGIQWSLENGIQIISMSLGGDTGTVALEQACDNACNAGVLIVAAAGNDGNSAGRGDTVDYPARYDSVIAVAATDNIDQRARWSSTGPAVEISAPGVSILSTYPGNHLATMSGTSMACPHVTGTAALVIASDSSLSNDQVRLILRDTADYLGDPYKYGYGLVDADGAAPPTEMPNQPPVADAGGPYSGTEDTAISFDGSGSSDPDEDDLTYLWDFGDSSTGTGINPTHTYAAGGTYTVTLVVNDGTVDSAPSTTTATVTEETSLKMHIHSISMSTRNVGINTNAIATVTVVNINKEPVVGATVSGDWTGLTGDSDAGITDASGTVILISDRAKRASGTFTFTVDDVSLSGLLYDPSANVETSDSITV